MGLTHDQIVAQVKTTAGVDASDADISTILNHLIGEMAVESEWTKAQIELGPTVANQSLYTLPDNVARVLRLRIDGFRFDPIGTGEEWDLESGRAQRSDTGIGVFAEAYGTDGTKQIEFYPAPSAAGDPIEALVVKRPATISQATLPPFPDEFHLSLVYGTKAHFLALSEENIASAERLMAQYETAKAKLLALSRKRLRSGPVQMGIVGLVRG